MIYADHNATAPLRPETREAMTHALAVFGNPSSVHAAGRAARALVEEARAAVARFVYASPAEVVFTGGGTEANALALEGAVRAGNGISRIVISAIEHDSVTAAAERTGLPLTVVPVTPAGVIDRMAYAAALALPGRALVSVMLANNETGVIQPVCALAEQARAAGHLAHCDAIQGAGRIEVNWEALGLDMMTIAAHKFGGPKGAGALVVREGVALAPVLAGGGQERGRRAGTENVPVLAGFGAAARAADPHETLRMNALRVRLESELPPEAIVIAQDSVRLPNTICVALPGVPAETQVMALDLEGVCVSAGAACSSGKVRPSRVLAAMGHAADIAGCAIRISLGWNSTEGDIRQLLASYRAMVRRLALRAAA